MANANTAAMPVSGNGTLGLENLHTGVRQPCREVNIRTGTGGVEIVKKLYVWVEIRAAQQITPAAKVKATVI